MSSAAREPTGLELDQHTSILEAIAQVIAEPEDAARWEPGELGPRLGIDPETFRSLFEDREAALLAAFELGVRRAAESVVPAYERETRWLDAIRAALGAALRFTEREPALARLIVIHSMGGGPRVLERRMQVLGAVAAAVDRGRLVTASGRQPPPPVIAEALVGAVLAVLANRLLSAEGEPPTELFGTLSSIIVLPYLGPGVARRELSRPLPPLRGERAPRHREPPLAGGPRLTYRTARVLSAIEGYPGASNREVAERAGIVDQGQISKLLGRLEERALIAKIGEGSPRGAPNAWRLTEQGEMVVRSDGLQATLDPSPADR